MLEKLTWYKQSAFRWRDERLVLYIDPWGLKGDLPPADLVLITHAHGDHYSPDDIKRVSAEKTVLVAPADVAKKLSGNVKPIKPGDRMDAAGVKLEAVPAYNIAEERLEMHPQANKWVGYIFTLGSNSYYHAGDTDHLDELSGVRADVAFLPIGGTYTMDPGEAAGLAKAIAPQIAVPMHYGFVVGSPSDAERFAKEADPVRVEALTPTNPFEQS